MKNDFKKRKGRTAPFIPKNFRPFWGHTRGIGDDNEARLAKKLNSITVLGMTHSEKFTKRNETNITRLNIRMIEGE